MNEVRVPLVGETYIGPFGHEIIASATHVSVVDQIPRTITKPLVGETEIRVEELDNERRFRVTIRAAEIELDETEAWQLFDQLDEVLSA